MGNMVWGLMGRETIGSERRVRTLGLEAAVRNFNEMAVPGLGGAWFGRQLFLATLGVAVNELARREGSRTSNIEVANALEALGCWHAIARGNSRQEPRVKGRETLPPVPAEFSFAQFSRRSFYVTQPMRMQSVQPVLELGLVTSSGQRFNSYSMTDAGHAFLDAAFVDLPRPHGAAHLAALKEWVRGSERNVNTDAVRQLLSPAEPMPKAACEHLRDLLVRGGGEDASRRRNLLAWFEDLRLGRSKPSDRPAHLTETHWHEIQAGRLFFKLQAAALAVLDVVEAMLAQQPKHEIALESLGQVPVREALARLRETAAAYLKHEYKDRHATGASSFARECADTSDVLLIKNLVSRDERVLRLRDGKVIPGSAFMEDAQFVEKAEDEEQPGVPDILPAGLSFRLNNLYLLNLDLNGALAAELKRQEEARNG